MTHVMGLRELPTEPRFTTSTHKLLDAFYVPALARSVSYDRGVGYFTSQWLRLAASGLAGLAANGGHARIVASPMLDPEDCAAVVRGSDARNDPKLRAALGRTVERLESDLSSDTLATLAWMIADELLDFKVAVPTGELDGDFHDKFGIFSDIEGDAVAFHGSPNDSAKAFRNYESISVYYSWVDAREALRVQGERSRFDLIWGNGDVNLRVYSLPDAVRRDLVAFTSRSERPYPPPHGRADAAGADDRWRHQREAVAAFLAARRGILAMATGTGKTRTAIAIMRELCERDLIGTAVVAGFGTDLLDQWGTELLRQAPMPVARSYERFREAQSYLNDPRGLILLTSRQGLADVLSRLDENILSRALLVCDEVHGMGSPALASALEGRLKPFAFALGLSATPEREYDQAGNRFVEDEIGPVVFEFGLEEAISRGILCEFDYVPLEYAFSDADHAAVHQAVRRYHAKVKAGEAPSKESLFQELARVRKLSTEKLAPFGAFVAREPEVLRRCIVFVETAEYGHLVQDALMARNVDFHTYYGDDDRRNLDRFARGDLECLLTCHRVSEGIDIRSVNNVILFSSARARLETVQRLGRCLRSDPNVPDKRAKVVDFVRVEGEDDGAEGVDVDAERRTWLLGLAATRRGTPSSKPHRGGTP